MESKHIPADWFCPITGEVMTDPVIATDGNTYERKAILEWIEKNDKSPITGEALHSNAVVPNLALKSTIEKMLPDYVAQGLATKSEPKINSQSEDLQLVADSIVQGDHLLVNVSVVPPKEPKSGKRKPCAIICILDISGSMDTEASQADPNDKEAHGFSRLDLVKHSVNTVINSLSEGDYLALVPFSDTASVRLPLTSMDKTGRGKAEQIINDMKTEGSTNIWDGLRVGLDLTKQPICSSTNTYVLLLTDGEPNQNPPEGNLPALQNYIKNNGLTSNIHVFGYGYNLDTLLLTGIAKEGLGSYGYIPDCSMVGTIFVNFLSNTLATFTNIADLTVHAHHAKLVAISGYETYPFGLGGIQYGQNRDILFHFTLPDGNKNFAEFELHYGFGKKKVLKLKVSSKEPKDLHNIQFQLNRSAHIDGLTRAYASANNLPQGLNIVRNLLKTLQSSPIASTDEHTKCLIRDIVSTIEFEGQVTKAF
jgi:Mg-chelatase subunit ChlD